jgi:hypothetical protein
MVTCVGLRTTSLTGDVGSGDIVNVVSKLPVRSSLLQPALQWPLKETAFCAGLTEYWPHLCVKNNCGTTVSPTTPLHCACATTLKLPIGTISGYDAMVIVPEGYA